jgi:hypothetical protein
MSNDPSPLLERALEAFERHDEVAALQWLLVGPARLPAALPVAGEPAAARFGNRGLRLRLRPGLGADVLRQVERAASGYARVEWNLP